MGGVRVERMQYQKMGGGGNQFIHIIQVIQVIRAQGSLVVTRSALSH